MTPQEQLDALAQTIDNCQLCKLSKTRKTIVFGEGNPHAKILFIGEGPGADEDRTGRPFCGKAGQLLTKILHSANINREDVYITNIVKCRPPGNRNPQDDEIAACERYLLAQIEAICPQIIVALGNVPKSFFLGNETGGITKVRGRVLKWESGGIDVFPMFHPSYLLRNSSRQKGSPKWQTWQDALELARLIHI